MKPIALTYRQNRSAIASLCRGQGIAAVLAALLSSGSTTRATDYAFNLTTGTGAWGTATVWTPNGTPGAGDNIDATSIGSSGATLTLGGTTRTINNLTKTVANRWNISGGAATLSTLNVNNITIGTNNMIFFDGSGGGGLQVNATNITVTAGTLFFGSTSLSASNLSRGVAVSGTTTVSGGALQINVSNLSGNNYSLGLLDISGTGLVSINNAPTGKTAATANVSGLNGSAGFIQTVPAVGQNGNWATLAITNIADYSSGTVLRDGLNNNYGATLSVTKAGTGTQTLNGSSTFTGAVNITNGILKLGNASALGARTGIVAANTDNGTNVSGTGTLDLGGQTGITEVIRLTGTGFGGNGALINSGAAASIASGVAAIQQTVAGSTAPTLMLSGGGGTGATATLSMGLTPSTFTINGGTTTYSVAPTVTISGGGAALQGTATAVLNGSGVVTGITISAVGAGYTGTPNITFSGGTVSVAGTNPTGTGNATNFTPVGYNITNVGSGYTSAPSVSFSNGSFAASTSLAGVVLMGDSSIGGSGDITVNGLVSESGGTRVLTKVGTNTLTLANAGNSYTGATIINGGAVGIVGDAGLGVAPVAATPGHLTLNNGGLTTNGTFTLDANRGIVLGTLGGQVQVDSGALTYGGIVTGTGSLKKAGAGALILSGANAYGGGTMVAGGTLSVAADAALGAVPGAAAPSNVTLDGGTLATTADFALEMNRGIFLGAAGGTLDVASATTVSYGGTIEGLGNLGKAGAGTLNLTSANSYTGTTAINAGSLAISHDSALGSTNGGTTVASGGTLALAGGITVTGEPLALAGDGAAAGVGALRNISGANVWTGDITASAAARINSDAGHLLVSGNIATSGSGNFNVGGNADLEISGVVSGPLAFFKSALGAGTVTLSNPGNTYTGNTTVGGGTLKISSDGNLGAVPQASVVNSLRIRGGASVLQATVDLTLSATRGVQLGTGGGAIRTDPATTFRINGVLSGGAADTLTKTGPGRLVLAGTNTYTGPTIITEGVMEIAGSIAATPISVTSGGTLLLSGGSEKAADASTVTLTNGTLAFSSNITGAVETLGALTLSGNSMLDFGANSGGSNTFIFAGLNLDGFELAVRNWTGPAGDVTQDRLLFSTSLAGSDLAQIKFFDDHGQFLGTGSEISFGNAFEIVPIPEPSSSALAGAAALLGFVGCRERARLRARRQS